MLLQDQETWILVSWCGSNGAASDQEGRATGCTGRRMAKTGVAGRLRLSKTQRRRTTQRAPARSTPPLSRMSRSQLVFVIISSLVVCSLIGGAFISLTFTDAFGSLFDGDETDQNYVDPNADIISAQETVVANNPDSVEELLVLANLLGNTQRLGDAIPYYERVLELAPEDVAARVAFARALADGGLNADAEFQFQRALEINPDNQPAHYYLAEMYMAETPARTEAAIEHYWRVVQIDPTTLIAERAQTQLDTMGAGTPPAASPSATPSESAETTSQPFHAE